MDITQAEIETMRQLATRLLDLADKVEGGPIEVPDEIVEMVSKKLRANICLACGEKIPEGSRNRRGQDDACYGTTRNRIRRGEVRERDLIVAGKMTAESKAPGRKAKMDANEYAAASVDELKKVTKKKK